MPAIIKGSKLITKAEPKTIHTDLFKKVDKNLKHEIDYIIKYMSFQLNKQ